MDWTINPHLFVPCEFTDSNGTKHTAANWAALASKVADYRARGKFPVGDPMREILDQVCAKHPHACRQRGQRVKVDSKAKGETLTRRILTSLALLTRKFLRPGQSAPLVPRDEARRRAEICKGCSKQKAWRGGCASCSRNAEELRKVLLAEARGTAFSDTLLGCDALGEDCRVTVWLPMTPQSAELPANCWRLPSV